MKACRHQCSSNVSAAAVPAGVRSRRVGRVAGLVVWLVDGERIRRDTHVDFTMGGTGARYSFVPAGEVWVEKILSPVDATATVLHEIVEYRAMRAGASYEEGHDAASRVELELRRRLPRLGKINLKIVERALEKGAV